MVQKKKKRDQVELLLAQFPEAIHDYKLLLLLYWKLIDDIDIPIEIITSIVENGTQPETISRTKRRLCEVDSEQIREAYLKLLT